MSLYPYPWRQRLRPASFRGATFHVEVDGKASGRRVALHEYPKRDTPYAEDMGRRARRHTIEGYVIMSPRQQDYTQERDALVRALETEGPGTLVHPSIGTEQVVCDQFSCTETRERGGYCAFQMLFIEAGEPGDVQSGSVDTGMNVVQAAGIMEAAAGTAMGKATKP